MFVLVSFGINATDMNRASPDECVYWFPAQNHRRVGSDFRYVYHLPWPVVAGSSADQDEACSIQRTARLRHLTTSCWQIAIHRWWKVVPDDPFDRSPSFYSIFVCHPESSSLFLPNAWPIPISWNWPCFLSDAVTLLTTLPLMEQHLPVAVPP